MAVNLAARVERGPAGRACRSTVQIFGDGQFLAAGAAEDGLLGEPFCRPDRMPAAAGLRVAGVTGEPFAAAEKLDCNPVGLAVVMAASGLPVDDRSVYFMPMNSDR